MFVQLPNIFLQKVCVNLKKIIFLSRFGGLIKPFFNLHNNIKQKVPRETRNNIICIILWKDKKKFKHCVRDSIEYYNLQFHIIYYIYLQKKHLCVCMCVCVLYVMCICGHETTILFFVLINNFKFFFLFFFLFCFHFYYFFFFLVLFNFPFFIKIELKNDS